MTPHEALDAAVDALVASRLGDHKGINGEEFVEAARAALEAAAPYMQGAEYDRGGFLESGVARVVNTTGKPIAIHPNPYRSQA